MLKSILFAVLCGLLVMVEEADAKLTCWHCLNDRCQESRDEWSRPSCDGFCYAVFNSEDRKVLARQCYDETDTFAETQILRVEGATPAGPSDDRTLLQFESIIRDKPYATPKMAIVICNKPNCNDFSYDEAQKTLARLSGTSPDCGSGVAGSSSSLGTLAVLVLAAACARLGF